jgi:hypothetical protein
VSIKVAWDNPDKTIIAFQVSGMYSWAEMHESMEEKFALLDTVDHKVCILMDMREAGPLPGPVLPNLKRMITMVHPNEGTNVIVGARGIMPILFDLIVKPYRSESAAYVFADTMEQAQCLLAQATCLEQAAAKAEG